MKTAEEWYEDSRKRYIPPSAFSLNTCYEDLPTGKDRAIKVISDLMERCVVKRAGYTATSIRGYHRHCVVYKKGKLAGGNKT